MDTKTFGVPCSNLKDVWCVDVPNTDEGEAFAMAVGAWFAGKDPSVMIQNSGLGNAVDIITSLFLPYKIPLPKLHLGFRHKPEHHAIMGDKTIQLLELLEYPECKYILYERKKK